jgi:DNA-binding response OmpR family regulator
MTVQDPDGADDTIIRCGEMAVDRERYLVRVGKRRVDLTLMEFNILVAIAEQAGRVAPYEALTKRFWDAASAGHRRRLAVLVSRLRSKLGDGARYIETVHRVGYRLSPS